MVDHNNQANSRRFDTHVNLKPELATRLPKLSQDVVDFLGLYGEVSHLLIPQRRRFIICLKVAEEVAQLPAVVAPDFDDSLPLTSYFIS